ncbi:putative nucleoside-diphosphate-sugar epimerase [Xylariales sp. AK1849]|nr:putative nucleoside-diphosphate-sugar epimerase [Xylariales sp. AK1849]
MHLILTGATGMVGSCVLDAMIKTKSISKISILSRRPVKMAEDVEDPRIRVIIHKDFNTYDTELLEQLKGASGCVWALGIAQSQVSRQDYATITKNFPLAAASAISSVKPTADAPTPFRFVYVAGGDTTTKPGNFTMFQARIKGEAELALAELCMKTPAIKGYSVRPYAVDMETHEAIKPYVGARPLIHRVAGYLLLGIFRKYAKDHWAPTEPLGEFLTELALGQHDAVLRDDSTLDVEKLDDFAIWSNGALRKAKGY